MTMSTPTTSPLGGKVRTRVEGQGASTPDNPGRPGDPLAPGDEAVIAAVSALGYYDTRAMVDAVHNMRMGIPSSNCTGSMYPSCIAASRYGVGSMQFANDWCVLCKVRGMAALQLWEWTYGEVQLV